MYNSKELRENEVWVFNAKPSELPNENGRLKTMRFGKQALDINGDRLDPDYMLPVFINKSELDLMDRIWGERVLKIGKD